MDHLETEYTPSKFSKRFATRDEVISHHIDFTRNESEKSRQNHNCHLNVAYGPTLREKLDVFGDDLPSNAPLFVFVHGGYWQEMDKWMSAYPVGPLVKNGIRTMIIDYDLCPNVTLEQLVAQVQKAFFWISNYVRNNSVSLLSFGGHSAGAHLVASCLTSNFMDSLASEIKLSAYLISGVYWLEELRNLEAANSNNILSLNEDNVRALSPQFQDFSYLNDRNVKFHVFAGEHESKTFQDQSQNFAQGPLKDLNVNFQLLSGLDHFDIVEKLTDGDYEITRTIIKNARE